MKKKVTAQITIGIVCMVLVYAVMCQFRNVWIIDKNVNKETIRIEEVRALLVKEQNKSNDLLTQLTDAQRNLEQYRQSAASSTEMGKAMKDELEKSNILAGLTELEGTGIIVTLNEGATTPTTTQAGRLESYIIHDGDIRQVIAELGAAGAEAISVNGQRIISTSGIRCVGPVIMVNDEKVGPPFEISAIGDPNTLEAAFNIKGGIIDSFKTWNIAVTVKKPGNVVIPKYDGVLSPKYAKIIEKKQQQGGNK